MTSLEALASGASLIFVLMGTVVGIRLLVLASRSRGMPETMLGLSLFSMAGLGVGSLAVAAAVGTPEQPSPPISAFGMAALAVGFGLTAEFTRRVFRPRSRVALILSGLSILALAIASGANIHDILTGASTIGMVNNWEWTVIRACSLGYYAWCGIESFQYWQKLEKRRALGLADPIVVNRFFLWSGVMGFSCLNISVPWIATVAGASKALETGLTVVTLISGVGLAFALYLAFLPPAAYVRRIRRMAS